MIKAITLSVLLAAGLSACTARLDENGVRTHTDSLRIERDSGYYDGYPYYGKSSKFCPPGQAKKGRC